MIHSAIIDGLKAIPVVIEAKRQATGGYVLLGEGISEAGWRESRIRVRAALCSLAPALADAAHLHAQLTVKRLDGEPLPKAFRASGLDLPFALAVLGLEAPAGLVFSGELSLAGMVRTCAGAFPVAELAQQRGGAAVLASEGGGAMPSHIPVVTLADAVQAIQGGSGKLTTDTAGISAKTPTTEFDLSEVLGQPRAIRAVTVAAVAGLGVTLVGSPGSGSTMLARRLTGILPETTEAERREIRRIASVSQMPSAGARPFRAPHHTASQAAVIGGGTPWRPGEVTLARHGVLLLDEVTEFFRPVLESLVQMVNTPHAPMPWIIAAMNPCPQSSNACYATSAASSTCTCTPIQLERHRDRVKDFRAAVAPVRVRMNLRTPDVALAAASAPTPSTAEVREAITESRKRSPRLWSEAPTGPKDATANQLALAIAALEGVDETTAAHHAEALSYLGQL